MQRTTQTSAYEAAVEPSGLSECTGVEGGDGVDLRPALIEAVDPVQEELDDGLRAQTSR